MIKNIRSKHIRLPQAELFYYPNFFCSTKADSLFQLLKNEIDWKEYEIKVFGKTYNQPRLSAFFNDSEYGYGYSNISLTSQRLTPTLNSIAASIYDQTSFRFNCVLLNYYRNGNDSNGWHADNEKGLGENPVIASISLGEPRPFCFKHHALPKEKHKLLLENGSLLVMSGEMQHYWKHQIPKTKKLIGERINLTYRTLLQ